MSTGSKAQSTADFGLLNTLRDRPLSKAELAPILRELISIDGPDLAGQVTAVFEKMSTLVYVANQVSNILDLDTLLDRILQVVTEVSHCERGTLFLLDRETGELVARVTGGHLTEEIRIPRDAGIAGSVFTSGKPVIIPDAYADSRFNPDVDLKTGYRTRNLLCTPVRTPGGEMIGVIQLLNRIDGELTDGDLVLLEAVTSQTATALRNAQLLDEVKRSREEEARLQEVVNTISSELQLRPLLRKIVEVITDLLSADRSTVFLNDPKTNELYSFLAQGLDTSEIRFPNHLGIAGSVFTTGEVMNIANAYADSRFNQTIDKQTGYRTQNILCMPIRNREGKKLGVTQVVNKHAGAFSKVDERRLAAFTSQVAIAIENATLFDEVATMRNYNESMLESMTNGLVTLDEDGRIQKWNRSFREIFNADPESVIGQMAHEYFAGKNSWVDEKIAKVVSTDQPDLSVDAELVLGDRKVSVNLNTVPLKSGKGEKLGTMLVFDDITAEKRMKNTMARYMDKDIAEKLMESGGEALGGICQTASVLFSDIRSFTSLAEALGPQDTVAMLNEYFTVMVECVFRQGGILDKFIGDALMALFGVPFQREDDADRAVRAAISMLCDLRTLNVSRVAAGKKPIDIGIGVNTDEVVSGNIGSVKRMDYTAIGDGVNLASRLESSCKLYHSNLIISEFTRKRLKSRYRIREIDRIVVKGKTEPVAIFEVLDHCDDRMFPGLSDALPIFEEGVNAYRSRDFMRGLGRFNEVLRIHPNDTLSQMYVTRCQHLLAEAPAEDWDGTFVMLTK